MVRAPGLYRSLTVIFIQERKIRGRKRTTKPKKCTNSTKEFSEQFEGTTHQNKDFDLNCTRKFTRKFGKIFVTQVLWHTFRISVPEKVHELKNPQDGSKVSLELPAGQTWVSRPVSQGRPVHGKTGTIWQFFRALFPSTWRTLSPNALFTRIRHTRKHPESATFSCFPC